jgi:hypothetical protein
MTRRETRYWLFRFKTEATGGCEALDAPEDLKQLYENQEIFKFIGGWPAFGATWDVEEHDFSKIVGLDESLWDTWNKHCARIAKPLPVRKEVEAVRVDRPSFVDSTEVDVTLNIH